MDNITRENRYDGSHHSSSAMLRSRVKRKKGEERCQPFPLHTDEKSPGSRQAFRGNKTIDLAKSFEYLHFDYQM